MNCNELELLAIEYREGTLRYRERELVERHTSSCAACAERLAGFGDVSRLLDTWENIRPSASFDARLEQQIAGAASGWWQRLTLGFFALQRPALAGVLSMVLLIAVALVRYFPSEAPLPEAHTPATLAAAAPEANDELALSQALPVLENWDMLSDFDVLQDLNGQTP